MVIAGAFAMLFKFFQLFEKSGLKYRFRKMLEKNVALDQDFQIRLPRVICVFASLLFYTIRIILRNDIYKNFTFLRH